MAFQQTTSRSPRAALAASLALVGIGVFLLKLCVFDVLEAAKRHETVSLHMKGVLVSPIFIILGLVAAATSFSKGKSDAWAARFTNPETKRLNPLGWVLVAGLLAVGGGLYFWLDSQLTALGYDT